MLAVYQAVMKQIHLKKLQVSSLVILVHSPGSHFCTTLSLFSLPAAGSSADCLINDPMSFGG